MAKWDYLRHKEGLYKRPNRKNCHYEFVFTFFDGHIKDTCSLHGSPSRRAGAPSKKIRVQ
jgi:hypothetical protein